MAQTGFTPIQLYFSSTTTNVPLAADLANGELAINITDGKLFYKDNAAAVQVIGWKVVPATAGGTGQTSYAIGDLLYANTTTTLAKLPDVATGNALISGGVGVAPSWGKIGLTTHVSGVLPVANGGTNASTASITSFNNITGYSASGATGTTTTNLVFSTSPSITTPTLVGNVNLSTGNITQGTAAKGVNFTANTPQAGMTSQLLNWYETGTFTPTAKFSTSQGDLSYAYQVGKYVRIGSSVAIQISIRFSETTAVGELSFEGLPFTSSNTSNGNFGFGLYVDNLTALVGGPFAYIVPNTSIVYIATSGTGTRTAVTNANTSSNATFAMSFVYFV